jgi:hypothetical protein
MVQSGIAMTARSIAAAVRRYSLGEVVLLGFAVLRVERTAAALVRRPGDVLEAAPVPVPGAIRVILRRTTPARLEVIVDHASRIAGGACLARALVLQALLRETGVWVTVAIGARRNGRTLGAHAWIETGGVGLDNAARPEAFVTLYRVAAVRPARD